MALNAPILKFENPESALFWLKTKGFEFELHQKRRHVILARLMLHKCTEWIRSVPKLTSLMTNRSDFGLRHTSNSSTFWRFFLAWKYYSNKKLEHFKIIILALWKYPSTHFKTFQKTLPIEKLPDFDLQEFEKFLSLKSALFANFPKSWNRSKTYFWCFLYFESRSYFQTWKNMWRFIPRPKVAFF